jgi:hypothetical protein
VRLGAQPRSSEAALEPRGQSRDHPVPVVDGERAAIEGGNLEVERALERGARGKGTAGAGREQRCDLRRPVSQASGCERSQRNRNTRLFRVTFPALIWMK